ncbi:MAG: Hsp70 family protein [Gammaproteobacteria bacterium]|nr:Hsp70 family protein [Gammaproteobacteria bacterium]
MDKSSKIGRYGSVKNSTIIGIDLGTTNSLVAVMDQGRPRILPNSLDKNLTPSVVGLCDEGKLIVGQSARNRLVTNPGETVALFKRHMGTDKRFDLGGKSYSAVEISALLLRHLKDEAQERLNTDIVEAVISVPAYFNESQRRATKQAGEIAGLKIERLINEPTAAAIFHSSADLARTKTVLVFDLGGGTLDVTILNQYQSVIEIIATAGNHRLGGEDLTDAIVAYFLKEHGLSQSVVDRTELAKLRHHSEYIKRSLLHKDSVSTYASIEGVSRLLVLTADKLTSIFESHLQQMLLVLKQAIRDAGILTTQLDEVVLVGGATQTRAVVDLVRKYCGCEPLRHTNPDEAIALGAALQAALKAKDESVKDLILTDVCSHSLGVEVVTKGWGGHIQSGFFSSIIDRNVVVPCSRERRFFTVIDNQTEVCLKVYQGEHRRVENNLLLGELFVAVEAQPAGEQAVDVRFSYDINGLLEVVAKVSSTGLTQSKLILLQQGVLTEEEVVESRQRLEALKTHPREKLANQILLMRAERVYQMTLGQLREHLEYLIRQYEYALDSQDERRIRVAAAALLPLLEQLDTEGIE